MSTRSDVIVQCKDGKVRRIYCHFDGYPSNNGVILQDHYTSQELAEALVAPGDLSSLGPMCDRPPGHSYATPVKDYTVYYGRDRGEDNVAARVFEKLEDAFSDLNEYTYVWKDGGWFLFKEKDKYVPLQQAIKQDEDGDEDDE